MPGQSFCDMGATSTKTASKGHTEVWLEVVTSPTTDTFLAALTKMIYCPTATYSHILRNNGTNFQVATAGFTWYPRSFGHSEQIQNYVSIGIWNWSFIPPPGQYFGSLWEASTNLWNMASEEHQPTDCYLVWALYTSIMNRRKASIKRMQYHFNRALRNKIVIYKELSTLLSQTEACLHPSALTMPLNNLHNLSHQCISLQ